MEKAKFEEREKEREGDMGSRAHSFLQKKTAGQGGGTSEREPREQYTRSRRDTRIPCIFALFQTSQEEPAKSRLTRHCTTRLATVITTFTTDHTVTRPLISLAKHDRGNLTENEVQERSLDVRAVEKASFLVRSPKCSCTGHDRCLNRSHPFEAGTELHR